MRSLRLGLPLVAAALVTIVFAWPRIEAAMAPARKQAAQAQPAAGRNMLVNPSYKSIDQNGQPFAVNASHAEQSLNDQDIILLDKPTSDMLLNSGHHVGAEADKGTYAQKEGRLFLEGHVVLHEDEGWRFTTSKMLLNTQTKQAFSDQPVYGDGPTATITATGVQGYAGDQVLVFTGPARMTIKPAPAAPVPAAIQGGTAK